LTSSGAVSAAAGGSIPVSMHCHDHLLKQVCARLRRISLIPDGGISMSAKIAARLAADGPKRMLALDGGGTRGIISIAFLEQIERTLAERFVAQGVYNDPSQFRLSHYFDMIGGTSVGSMLATRLALGHSVAEIKSEFGPMAHDIFSRVALGYLRHMFDADPLTRHVKGFVKNETLDTPKLETGLCVIMKRMDTGSVWPITNNPHARYWEPRSVDGSNEKRRLGNKEYKIWELIRSSTAAPRYFSEKKVKIFEGLDDGHGIGHFIDGAVSPHNSPALQMFMLAGIKGYNLGGGNLTSEGGGRAWKLGADKLLIVSVGTGAFAVTAKAGSSAALDAIASLQGMIADGTDLGLTLLQWLGHSQRPWVIDRELRSLVDDSINVGGAAVAPLLTFHRYDMKLENDPLNKDRSLDLPRAELVKLQQFEKPAHIGRLYELASAAALQQVNSSQFPSAFDAFRPIRSEPT
jgi:uncharacterized protein